MPDRKQQIKSLFMAAMQIESLVERATYLDECCAGDRGLRADVQELLGAEQNMGGFLEDRKAEPVATLDIPTDELESQMIGPYKTRELLGEGGMGAVYVAEQTEPVRRKVALKLIKPGMDSKAVIARFEAERQALAMMSHPNIAKILDAGTTEQGRPYFVMELVKGIPITKFCDQHKLSTTQRLELFSKVCQAVQHAHLKGIIHRDLKPSNVIVEVHDVEPVPKVIDFGIAKATNQQLTEQTIYTQHTQLIGTPLYMGPEQAQLSALNIDTRSDIYSLGVLLYELLSGTTPFERSELGSAGLDEMRRVICEVDPPRPSHQVSTLNNELASTISERRQTDRRNLSLTMQRELDWIVMKAMEKNRTRRYESASTLADDIRRYIENEPVLACPPSIVYRMRKHVHRHRTTVVGSLVMVVTMLIVASTMYYYHSEQQQRIKQEQNRLTDIRSDVEQTLQSVRTAVEAGDLELASKNLDQAKGQLDRSSEELPGVAGDFDKLKVEVTKRIEDQKRFEQLLVLADDAESKMTHSADLGGDKVAVNALGLFRVVDDADWLEKLNKAYLSGEQKKRASEVIYDTLVCLADFHVRWPSWCGDPASIKQSQTAHHRLRWKPILIRESSFRISIAN